MKSLVNFAKGLIGLVIAIVLLVILFPSNKKIEANNTKGNSFTKQEDKAPSDTAVQEQKIYSDKYIEVYFLGFEDLSDIDSYLANYLYCHLKMPR